MDTLTRDSFQEKAGKGSVIIDFYADWCGPCRKLGPIFEELSHEMNGVKFFKVNVEDAPDLAAEFNVQAIPTLLFFKDGDLVDRLMGGLAKDELRSLIEKHM